MKKLFLISLLIVVMIGLVASGCAEPAPSPSPAPSPAPAPEPAPAAPDEIRIGYSGSLTGMLAAFGTGNAFGIEAAVEDINKLGGVYLSEYDTRVPVRAIVVDCESELTKRGSLAEDLILRDNVHFLVSDSLPAPIRESTLADQYKIPNIMGGGPLEPWLARRSEVTPPWPYTWFVGFRIAMPPPPGDYRAGKPGYTIMDAWKGMLDRFGDQTNKKMGVFASDDPDGIGWYRSFPPLLKEWGYEVVGVESDVGLFPLETTDYTAIIKTWMKNDVEILWGNCPGAHFGTLWRQCHELNFKPKMVSVARAAQFYTDIAAWGGDLPLAVCTEIKWDPAYKDSPGIGDTTPESLAARWTEETGMPLNRNISDGYVTVQVLLDAIERAGTFDGEQVNNALADTDLHTIFHRVVFDPGTHFSGTPVFMGQWMKTDEPWVWEYPVVISKHEFVPATHEPIFPIPYE